jgi:hypothetical protein
MPTGSPTPTISPSSAARGRSSSRECWRKPGSASACSDAQRTRRTLDPLAQKRGSAFKVVAVPADGPGGIAAHVDKVAAELRALPAEAVAAVVGHTNTVPQIIAKLGAGSDGTAIGESEFDRLFVLFLTPGRSATLLRLRYGAAT